MRRSLSIGVLLQTVTIVMTVSLVAVCTVYALDALRNREEARRVPQILAISNDLYASVQNFRTETGNAFTLVASLQLATPEEKAELDSLGKQASKSLDSIVTGLASIPFEGQEASIAEIRAARMDFEGMRREVDGALQRPAEERPADLNTRWISAYRKLAVAMERVSNRLENELTRTDGAIAELVRIRRIAWSVRADTGRDRILLGTIIGKRAGITDEQRLELAAMAGHVDGEWKILKDRVVLPDTPPKLKEAVAAADDLYFTQVRNRQAAILADFMAGRPISRETRKWLLLPTPGQEAVFAVGKIAFETAGEHARQEFAAAQRVFYFAIGLMGFFCLTGVLTSWYVFRAVVRPVTKITEAMRSIAEGNLACEIPYEQRADEIGSLAHGLRVFRDNAFEKQRLRMEKDGAVAASRAKSEFLANVSHELRTPLNAIIGFSEAMKTEMFGPVSDRHRSYCADIFNSGTHLLGLINEILDLSKLEAGQLELHDAVVDIGATVDVCMNLIKEAARKADIHLAVVLDLEVRHVLADERRLRQILINLLSNAVKFTPEGGQITLATVRVPEGLAIQVKDTGIGIAEADIPKVLTPFGQVDSKISRKHEGTGLGLPLVKHLAELHGGSLNITSRVNAGTTVTVLLPSVRIVRAGEPLRAESARLTMPSVMPIPKSRA